MKIFINIASYRDQLLTNTLQSAYDNAKFKENLIFGVFEQEYADDCITLSNFNFRKQIRYKRIDPNLTKGVCWARNKINEMYDGEDYYLQIDAHTIFTQDWDRIFLDSHNKIKLYHEKPIITAYPNNFAFLEDGSFKFSEYDKNTICIIRCLEERNEMFKNMGFLPPSGYYFTSSHDILHGYFIGCCCIFADGSFATEVKFNPNIFFGGEESDISLRAWTRGYNFFHVKELPLYHCWEKNYGGVIFRDFNDIEIISEPKFSIDSVEQIHDLVNGITTGDYGLGNDRTIDQYKDFSGLDYVNKVCKENNLAFHTNYTDKWST